jgi:hypothetical protein
MGYPSFLLIFFARKLPAPPLKGLQQLLRRYSQTPRQGEDRSKVDIHFSGFYPGKLPVVQSSPQGQITHT